MMKIKKVLEQLSFLGSLRKHCFHESKKEIVFTIVCTILTIIIFFFPNGFEESSSHTNAVRAKAHIIEINNDNIRTMGPVMHGWQIIQVELLRGQFKGTIHTCYNHMTGKMEIDKYFTEGENSLVVLSLTSDNTIHTVQIMDHYRTDKIIFLSIFFIIAMIIIMGWMGIKILITFVFSVTMLIKVLYPMTLYGFDPIIGSLIITTVISALILFLVGGLTKRALSAFLGTVSGIAVTAILTIIFTYWFKIHGAVRPFSEMLLYIGFGHLNLVHLFIAGVFIGASGAMMDLSMNIAAAMDEIKVQQPLITRLQLMKSGYTIARQSCGTMATTLLLAYSAEYTAMIMVFIAQGIPFENIINMVWVSSEIVHTLVGCFGLMLIAPLTVLFSGIFLTKF